jgi:hypothetical protein
MFKNCLFFDYFKTTAQKNYHSGTIFCHCRIYFLKRAPKFQRNTAGVSSDHRATSNSEVEVFIRTVVVTRCSDSPKLTILKATTWQLR